MYNQHQAKAEDTSIYLYMYRKVRQDLMWFEYGL